MFEEVVHNFDRSDDDMICEKMLLSTKCKHGFMSLFNLIKKSWTDSMQNVFANFLLNYDVRNKIVMLALTTYQWAINKILH